MATFTEKILVKIDVAADNASKGLKDFRKSVGEAEGTTGKLKAGVSSLGGMFKAAASSPAVLAGGVAAAGSVALQAAEQFSELGVRIGKFADATGLSADQASRWVETADDLGIGADSLQGILGKLNKNIDPKLFASYGISIAKAADGTTDANQTFLNTLDVLSRIKDPAERAKTAAKLLGKGWQDAAELVGMSAKEVQDRLNGVADAKVFDEKKVKQARDYRDTMDELNDRLQAIALDLGMAVVPAIEDMASGLADVAETAGDAAKAMKSLRDSGPASWLQKALDWPSDAVGAIKGGIDVLRDGQGEFEVFGNKFNIVVKKTGDEANAAALGMGHLADMAHDAAKVVGEELAEKAHDAAYEAAQMRDRVSEATAKLKDLQDQIDGKKSLVDLKISLRDNAQKLADLRDEYAKGKMSAEDYFLKTQQLTLDSQGLVADYAEEVGNIPPEVATNIVATLDPSNPDDIFNTLQQWFNGRKLFVTVEGMIADSTVRNAQEGRGGSNPTTPSTSTPSSSGDGRGNRSSGAPVVNVNVRSMPTQRELTEFINTTRRRQGPVI